ncbi:anti-sigma factor family protein [Gemmatimonadota bacterium]
MNHDLWEELSSRYRDGDLEATELEQFEEHLIGCSECRELVQLDALIAGSMTATMDSAYPVDLESRVLALVEVEKESWYSRAADWLRHGELRLPAPVAIAAALVLIVLGTFALQPGTVSISGGDDREILALSSDSGSDWIDAEAAGQEVRSLLRRTRTLLLALSTAVPDEDGTYHLEAEEALSRDLIHEVRMFEAGTTPDDDTDIITLVRDLELILLDVSTWEGEADADRLALLQDGISERSLIYRVSTFESRSGDN